MPTVNSTALCTSTFVKRVDAIFSVITMTTKQTNKQKQGITKKLSEVIDVYYLDCVTVSWVCAYVQMHQMVHIKYVQVSGYQLYLSKAVLKKRVGMQVSILVPVYAHPCMCLYVVTF